MKPTYNRLPPYSSPGPRICPGFTFFCPCLGLDRLKIRFAKLKDAGFLERNGKKERYAPTGQEEEMIDYIRELLKNDAAVVGDGA